MLSTYDGGSRRVFDPVVVSAPDPARGIGRALRSVYTPGASGLPSDMEALLNRLH